MGDTRPVASEQDADWMTKPVWTWWQREKDCHAGNQTKTSCTGPGSQSDCCDIFIWCKIL